MQRMNPATVRAWALALFWAAVIWSLGGDNFSYSETSRFIGPFMRWIYPEISPEQIAQLQGLVRKSAHLIEYGLLGVLILRALRLGTNARLGKRARAGTVAGIALLMVIVFASADETRQAFSNERGGSVWDVLLDAVGGAAGVTVLLLFARRRELGTMTREHHKEIEGLPR